VKFLNYVVYEYILIKRVTEEVERMLTAVNVNKVFIQFLMLVLSCFIEAARTLLLNKKRNKIISFFFLYFLLMKITTSIRTSMRLFLTY